ncbi:MAG: hypothetical protein OEZ58_20560 [Gammaproteobacteria bacterium]|nr:hypothetical protein [Gammaproteobacteria bacterium]MDH5731385.1 hypothetical protein [Gammaproteobacteria bacterium]
MKLTALHLLNLGIVLFMLFPPSLFAYSEQDLARFYGNWNGAGLQGNKYIWDVQFIIDKDTKVVNFISISCSGNFDVSEVSSSHLTIRYTILTGNKKCAREATFKFQKTQRNELSFEWIGPGGRNRGHGFVAK